jgi:hypothetical protein
MFDKKSIPGLTECQDRLRKALYESVAIDYWCTCLRSMGEQDIDRQDIDHVLRTGTLVRTETALNHATEIWTVAGVTLDGLSLEVSVYARDSRISVVRALAILSTEE